MNIQTDEGEETVRLRKPVTQKNLTALDKDGGVKINWQDYRLKMLDWFDENGSEGIGKLMRSTMKALRKSI
jgi:centromere protein I